MFIFMQRKMTFSEFLTSSDISAGLPFPQDYAEIADMENSFLTFLYMSSSSVSQVRMLIASSCRATTW